MSGQSHKNIKNWQRENNKTQLGYKQSRGWGLLISSTHLCLPLLNSENHAHLGGRTLCKWPHVWLKLKQLWCKCRFYSHVYWLSPSYYIKIRCLCIPRSPYSGAPCFKTLPYLSVAPQLASINTSWIELTLAGNLNSMAGSPRDNWGTCDKFFQPAGKENVMGRKMRFDFSASSCFEHHRRWRLARRKPVSNPPEHHPQKWTQMG